MKVVVAAFNQEKALVGAFSVIMNLRMELFEALVITDIEVILVTMVPCCRCWLGQGLGAPGAAGGGGGQAARAQVSAVNQEKALVRTFFVIVNSADGSIAALVVTMTLSGCSEGGGRGELRIDSRSSSLNVSALVGKQAVLACTVTNINNHSVGLLSTVTYIN